MRSRILYSIRACKRSVSEVENGVEWAENRVEPDGRAEQGVVRAWQKTMEREQSAEWEVAGRGAG